MTRWRRSSIIARTTRYRTIRTGAVGGSLRARGTCEYDPEYNSAGETQSFDHENAPFSSNGNRGFFLPIKHRAAIYHSAGMERIENNDGAFQIRVKADKFEDDRAKRDSRMAIVERLKPGEIDGAPEQAEALALRGEGLVKV